MDRLSDLFPLTFRARTGYTGPQLLKRKVRRTTEWATGSHWRYTRRARLTSPNHPAVRALAEYAAHLDADMQADGVEEPLAPYLRDMHVHGWTPELLDGLLPKINEAISQDPTYGHTGWRHGMLLRFLARTTSPRLNPLTSAFPAASIAHWVLRDGAARSAIINGQSGPNSIADNWVRFALKPHTGKGLTAHEAFLAYRARITPESYTGKPSEETREAWEMMAALLPDTAWDFKNQRTV